MKIRAKKTNSSQNSPLNPACLVLHGHKGGIVLPMDRGIVAVKCSGKFRIQTVEEPDLALPVTF